MENTAPAGIKDVSRRELLGRGVKLGGAVLWMTPVVQTFGIGRAFASEPSGNCVVYCVKYEVDTGKWEALGSHKAHGKGSCFTCPSDAVNGLPVGFADNAVVAGSPEVEMTIRLPQGCSVLDVAEDAGTPDEFTGGAAVAVKCGSQRFGADACRYDVVRGGGREFTVEPCGNGKAISNIEIVVKCCPT